MWPTLVERVRDALPARMQALRKAAASAQPFLLKLPACLCMPLCLMSVVKGTNQTGYTNTFYRYSRDVMESERILLDNGFRERYGMLMAVAEHVEEDQKILITRSGISTRSGGAATCCTTNPIVPLMNLPLEEVEAALEEMQRGHAGHRTAISGTSGTDPLSTLNAYLETLSAAADCGNR